MLDDLELDSVLADMISKGRALEEREEAVRAWEEKILEMAGQIGTTSKANMDASISGDAPESSVSYRGREGVHAKGARCMLKCSFLLCSFVVCIEKASTLPAHR